MVTIYADQWNVTEYGSDGFDATSEHLTTGSYTMFAVNPNSRPNAISPDAVAVPEPASAALLSLAAAGILGIRRFFS
ncbi:PEP-CTERM sorting domain-containing protein [Verrucomicrobiota bacterium]